MTVHEKFRRCRAALGISVFLLAAIVVIIGSLVGRHDVFFVRAMGIMIFCAVLVGIVLLQVSFRCPRCGKPLSAVNVSGTSPSSFPRYWPNCGLDLQSVDDDT
jgi:hypothetical protein